MNQAFLNRIRIECDLLASEIGGRGHGERISAGRVGVAGKEYLGIIIRGLSVNPQKFDLVKAVNMLVLVPSVYPEIPPLGIYLNQPYNVSSSHFVEKGYHGAPSLEQKGWYWFCHSFGGFDKRQMTAAWKPTADPGMGHNLATVVSAARIVMNQ